MGGGRKEGGRDRKNTKKEINVYVLINVDKVL